MLIRQREPGRADRLERAVSAFGGVVLVLLIAALVWPVRDRFWETLGMVIALTVIGSEAIAVPSAVYGFLMYFSATALVVYGRRLAVTRTSLKAEVAERPVT